MTGPSQDELLEEFRPVLENGEPIIQCGDCYPIDNYTLLLQHLGYAVEYKNIHSDYGFIAQVRIDGTRHAVWQGGILQTDHSVLAVQQPLSEFEPDDANQGALP